MKSASALMNIGFVYPAFLWALLLITIPVIIHLFNFRRFRKVLFTNVRFLSELKEETTSRSRLKHLLVLLARILAVIFLVLAFAQPYIPAEQGLQVASSRAVSIYIDNSFSMEAVTRDGTLLDVAIRKAKDVAQAFKPGDRFQLLTCDFDPAGQRLLTRDEFIAAAEQVRISPVSRRLDEVIERQRDVLSQSGAMEQRAMLISDFQKSTLDVDRLRNDSSLRVTWIPVSASRNANAAIDTCWFTAPVVQPGQPVELVVRIRNYGSMEASAIPLKLLLNGMQRAVASADVAADGYADVKLTFTVGETGWQNGMLSIADNPIVFDDKYYFSFYVSEHANLLSIYENQPDPYLKALFPDSGYFRMTFNEQRQVDYSAFSSNTTIFLNELQSISSGMAAELQKYLSGGGTVVLVPDSAADLQAYGQAFGQMGIPPFVALRKNDERVEKLALEDEIFQGVFSGKSSREAAMDLPAVRGYFTTNVSGTQGEPLMQLRDGSALLARYRVAKGEAYVFALPWSGSLSNLARHAVFVPVVYRIALLSMKSDPIAFEIGRNESIDLRSVPVSGDQVFHLINPESGFDVIPSHRALPTGVRIGLNGQVQVAGNYQLKQQDKVVAAPAFNFNRRESEMEFYDVDALKDLIGTAHLSQYSVLQPEMTELKQKMTDLNDGIRLWKYCILLTLLFLACETLLLKYWKT